MAYVARPSDFHGATPYQAATLTSAVTPERPSRRRLWLRTLDRLSDKRINLARNWARLFPRAPGPAAGVAAVRSGHVMLLESSAGDGQWLVRDYNSGGGLSRLHVRDVRGYIFVNPRGTPAAKR